MVEGSFVRIYFNITWELITREFHLNFFSGGIASPHKKRSNLHEKKTKKLSQFPTSKSDVKKELIISNFSLYSYLISAFGIGSMIYSGLEFGQYFELERDTKCHNVLLALTPATRMAFIFIQMYFIFLNNEVSWM